MIQEKAAQGAVGVFVSILNRAVSTVKRTVRMTEVLDEGACWWGSAALLFCPITGSCAFIHLFLQYSLGFFLTAPVAFDQNVQNVFLELRINDIEIV